MTNWEKHFGTPEKAANSIENILSHCLKENGKRCHGCLLKESLDTRHGCYKADILVWLQEEADDMPA